MKRLLIGFALLVTAASAQDSLKTNITTLKKGEKYIPVTELKVGYDNIIRIKPKADSIKRISVQVSPGAVLQRGEDYVVRVDQPGDAYIDIYNFTDEKKSYLLERRKFPAVKSTPVKATVAGLEL